MTRPKKELLRIHRWGLMNATEWDGEGNLFRTRREAQEELRLRKKRGDRDFTYVGKILIREVGP